MHVFKQSETYDSTYSNFLHPNEYSQKFHYYPLPVELDRCVASCLTKYVFQIKHKI